MSIGADGVALSHGGASTQQTPASKKRVSSGISRLDTMLGGGYFQGSSILITGAPGTSKSTLAASFAEAACLRGEGALYISFDENQGELVRNFSSVGIRLLPHITSGKLHVHCIQADGGNAKEHYENIQNLLKTYHPSTLVIDPLTALIKSGGEDIAQNISERLMRLAKSLGITTLNTSLLNSADEKESTPIQISTIADTWIHLSYLVRAGERNRALTIVKSRGTRHSNQVRELILSEEGVTLSDIYSSGGEVLMGTMRWQKEQADLAEEKRTNEEMARRRLELEITRAELESRLQILQREMKLKEAEMKLLLSREESRKTLGATHLQSLRSKRDSQSVKLDEVRK
jgi:circadian clock protein KaiC